MTLSLVSLRQGMIMYRVALLSRNARRKRSELLEYQLLIRFARGPFLRNTESQIVPMHERIQDTGILSHIWETCVPNVYAFSLHEYKPGVHRNIYTHCTDGRCMRERRVSILHHDARGVPWYKTHDTCVRAFNTPWTYRSLWHNKSEGAEYNAASCAQWPPWKLWNVPPILPSHSIQPGEDSRGVRRRKHFSRLLILKISEPVRDDRS